jgi:hypothetical protein
MLYERTALSRKPEELARQELAPPNLEASAREGHNKPATASRPAAAYAARPMEWPVFPFNTVLVLDSSQAS